VSITFALPNIVCNPYILWPNRFVEANTDHPTFIDPEQPMPAENRAILLKNYTPPAYLVDSVELTFDLDEHDTRVHSRLAIRRNPDGEGGPLTLDGEHLALDGLLVDGVVVPDESYRLSEGCLTLLEPPEQFVLDVATRCDPGANAALEGLYLSSDMFCTQCEAEGFRRITYYPDRPDVMARFTVTVRADATRYPILLSNGNRDGAGELPDGRHWARWVDPFPKPSYLFALVAGDLVRLESDFTTMSGREVALHLFVEARNRDKGKYALTSLQQAMRWDEERFGREYDLDLYMIVAVDDFNMGAMENKGLNVFNSSCVLASAETATDADFLNIQSIVGHEYFHNWSGNRVTLRDWFQLSLKEGLTVFRDQEFSADLNSRPIQRIQDVNMLRTHQFAEDGGPMAHPVRTESYEEINNFYTATVYNKGAEVVRMLMQLVGRDGFRRGLDLYFERHDGQAVTVEAFLAAQADANQIELTQFSRWYQQAGTPRVHATGDYDAARGEYRLTLEQQTPATPGQLEKAPFTIPVRMALLDAAGECMQLQLADEIQPVGTERVLVLDNARTTYRFTGLAERPLPSLLRGFSAPVVLEQPLSNAQLAFLWQHDDDGFRRWEAGQELAERIIRQLIAGEIEAAPESFFSAFKALLTDASADSAFRAQALLLPNESYLAGRMQPADPAAIHQARDALIAQIGERMRDELWRTFRDHQPQGAYSLDGKAIGDRALKILALGYLAKAGSSDAEVCATIQAQYQHADNMTDRLAALRIGLSADMPGCDALLQGFYEQWQDDALVVDKWFSLQATDPSVETVARIAQLLKHAAFNMRNPNRVRAVIGAFANGNPVAFHAPDGSGYQLLAAQVAKLDAFNPQIAARLALALTRWQRFIPALGEQMRGALTQLRDGSELSKDLAEVVRKGLVSA
jgi:aminopeptidase N